MTKIHIFIFFLFLYLFVLPSAFAEEQEAHTQEGNEDGELFEETRSSISSSLFSLTDEIDALFNDARSIEQRQDDWIRLGFELRFRTADAMRIRQRVGAGFNLDKLSEKLRLIFEVENGDAYQRSERVEDTPQSDDFIRQTNRDGGSGALRYFILKNEKYQLTTDAGARLSGGLNLFARIRGSIWFELSEVWSMEPAQMFFVERKEGYGSRSRLDFNRLIDEDRFLRLRNEVFWSEESRGFEFFEEMSYLSRLSEDKTLSVALAMVAVTDPDPVIDTYRASLRYRAPLIGKWLHLVLEPGIAFPEDRDYRRTPFISIRLDALFDRRSAALDI